MIDSNNDITKLSKSLLAAVRGVMEGKEGTAPKSEKEKDLAAKAPPHDKVTHADVLVGRGVLKKHPKSGKLVTKEETSNALGYASNVLNKMRNEEAEELDELSTDTLKSYRNKARAQGNKIVDKRKMGGGDWSKDQKDTQTLRKRSKGANMSGKQLVKRGESLKTEEVEEIDEALDAAARYGQHHVAIKELMKSISQHVESHKTDALKHRDYRGKKGVHWGHVGDVAQIHSQLADIHDRLAQQGEYKRSMAESLDEAKTDGVAAGSMEKDGHLCATKVFHKEWAEGTPIFSQHAEPDENGDIAWYDVMFEHGIERVFRSKI